MDESLSLKFNTMEKMKTVGNYEEELRKLYEENFELKHQVAYLKANQHTGQVDENIQKLLFDSKQSIDILENENKNLNKQVENMREVIRSCSDDRENLKDKLKEYENKLQVMEEENDRLLNHLNSVRQKSDSLNETHKSCELKIQEYEKRITEITNYVKTLEGDKELYFTEGKKLLDECSALQNKLNGLNNEKMQIENDNENLKHQLNEIRKEKSSLGDLQEKLNKIVKEKNNLSEEFDLEKKEMSLREQKLKNLIGEYENNLKQKNLEIEELKTFYNDKLNNQDYKNKFDKLSKELENLKREKENLLGEMKSIGESYSTLKRKLEVVEDDKRALKYKLVRYENNNEGKELENELERVQEEYRTLKRAHEKYKESSNRNTMGLFQDLSKEIDVLYNEISLVLSKINNLNLPLKDQQRLSEISNNFLINLNIPTGEINTIVGGFKKVYEKMKNKIDVLNNEIKDISKFNGSHNNNRIAEVVQSLAREFKSAREELNETKKYLEKKAKEIKELKKEKFTIENKLSCLQEQYNTLKSKDIKIKESYNSIVNKLRQKDDQLNKYEMRMFN